MAIKIPWKKILKSLPFFALCRFAACIAWIDGVVAACAIFSTSEEINSICICDVLKDSPKAKRLCRISSLGIDIVGKVRSYIGCDRIGH